MNDGPDAFSKYESYLVFKLAKKKDRVTKLIASSEDVDHLVSWGQREKYRVTTEVANTSLSWLLEKANDAKETALAIENGQDPSKGKKKK